ncbi:MAG: bifunctional phosphoserine phosphatase/homoserine phosphotransferase ThrH [Lachnospiraceae bacterium]|nr:bifunctional phosphoserine phosphatase/homoserine phosphotransferase ThrH [Lachnospiraceae bacterium]
MNIVCLDLEGVLVPEIWVEVANKTGIEVLNRTTRDEPDYDVLMKYRMNILKENNLKIYDIQRTIAGMSPIEGALEFLDALREKTQVMIISDTFEQFAMPLMKKLKYPTILCNTLSISGDGYIEGYTMRVPETKKTTVKALQALGYDTIASGDSFNDLGMIRNSKAGFLFKSTDAIKTSNPDIPAYETYEELMSAIDSKL